MSDAEIVNVPFPFEDGEAEEEKDQPETDDLPEEENHPESDHLPEDRKPEPFHRHPIVLKLRKLLQLDHLCGYIVLLKLNHHRRDRTSTNSDRGGEIHKIREIFKC